MRHPHLLPLLLLTLLPVLPALPAAAQELPVVRVGVVFDGSSSITGELLDLIRQEILTLTEGEFDVRFEDRDILTGDWTVPSVDAAIDRLLSDGEVDLVLALGLVASQTFCCHAELPKPVIAGLVVDPALQGLPEDRGTSGVHNLSYLSFPASFERDVDLFREITPFRRLTAIFNRWFLDVVPELGEKIRRLVAEKGLAYDAIAAGSSVDEVLANLPADAEAVYLAPLLHLTDAERQRLIDGLKERRLPSFSMFGVSEVAQGVLAGQRDQAFYNRLARRIALNVQRILLGEDAGTIPVAVPDRKRLTINMETAREIGVFPPWHLLTEADLLNEEPEFARVVTLREAVEEAIEKNLDLAARRRAVAAGAGTVARARSALKPRLDASLAAVMIDEDRASSTFSAQAERTLSGGLTLTQLIYSDPALANVRAQGYAQLSREQELEQLRLDIARDAMVTYLNVLLAQTVEEIRKNNLGVSRSNLELAQVRRSVGYAGPAEVFRWESEVATARRDLVEARAATYQTKIALNRLLHRRLEEGYRTPQIVLDESLDPEGTTRAEGSGSPALFRSGQQILDYTGTPLHFEVFREFMAEEGLARAPELAQLDAAIDAQKRILASARRAFYLPEAALRAEIDRVLERGGAGEGGPGLELPFPLEIPGDTSWSLALTATLPLFSGGARRAEVVEAEETLAELELVRQALAERLEQLIRSNLYASNASFAGIRLTREAAAAARKNLELVTDAYSQGVVDVLELLDAQNAALSADLAAASALYQFYIDLVEVERSVNWFEFDRSAEELQGWLERVERFFSQHGIEPRPAPRTGNGSQPAAVIEHVVRHAGAQTNADRR